MRQKRRSILRSVLNACSSTKKHPQKYVLSHKHKYRQKCKQWRRKLMNDIRLRSDYIILHVQYPYLLYNISAQYFRTILPSSCKYCKTWIAFCGCKKTFMPMRYFFNFLLRFPCYPTYGCNSTHFIMFMLFFQSYTFFWRWPFGRSCLA